MLRKTSLILTLATVLVVPVAIELAHAAGADDIVPPPVPSTLRPEGQVPFLIGHATGTQNYSCLPSGTGYAWTLFGPQATLFDDNEQQLITHFLSANPIETGTPLRATWQHSRDTSTVWAVATAISTDPNYVAPGAIPWLLLRVVGAQYGPALGDKLVRTTSIQRVNTAGGSAPATGCSAATDIGKKALVPYTADYVFYRE